MPKIVVWVSQTARAEKQKPWEAGQNPGKRGQPLVWQGTTV